MFPRTALLTLGLLALAGCGGSGVADVRQPTPQPTTSMGTGASQESGLPEPSRSRRLPSRPPGATPIATGTTTGNPLASSTATKSAAEQAFDDALTALPGSQFQVTYALVNAPSDALTVRWRPPQAAAEFEYLGTTYQVSGNSETGAVDACIKVGKRWVCDEQVEVQAVDPDTLAAVLAAVNPELVAAAAAELASLPGAQFRTDEIAGVAARCVIHSATTICLADTGAPLLAEAVAQLALSGFSDISLRATDYDTDSGL